MTTKLISLEFIGGPLDGHVHLFSALPGDLAEMIALPINANVFRMLDGQQTGPAAPARTVAFYKLECGETEGRYHFVGSCLATDLNLESWTA
jgi:hypothetical protein